MVVRLPRFFLTNEPKSAFQLKTNIVGFAKVYVAQHAGKWTVHEERTIEDLYKPHKSLIMVICYYVRRDLYFFCFLSLLLCVFLTFVGIRRDS